MQSHHVGEPSHSHSISSEPLNPSHSIADTAATVALPPGTDMVLVLADGQRFNITQDSDETPRASIAFPQDWSYSVTLEATPESKRAFERCLRSFNSPLPATARQKARAGTKVLQVIHDKHAHNLKSPLALAERAAIHRNRQAAKAARNANPDERAAALEAIKAPVLQRRVASGNSIAFKQTRFAAAVRAHFKAQRDGRTYPADGTAAHPASQYRAAVAA